MTIYHGTKSAQESETAGYVERDTSIALPMLTAQVLTEMLDRTRKDRELSALLAFDEWLQSF